MYAARNASEKTSGRGGTLVLINIRAGTHAAVITHTGQSRRRVVIAMRSVNPHAADASKIIPATPPSR